MSASLPSPPVSRSGSPSAQQKSKDELSEELDCLLEEYLECLDKYTLLRKKLSGYLSSGFFALAQAQKSSNIGAGRRYGQDCYDERMKTLREANITQEHKHGPMIFHIVEMKPCSLKPSGSTNESNSHEDDEVLVSMELEPSSSDKRKLDHTKPRDPLKWFGILTPHALRQTQTQFTLAVSESVPELINVASQLTVLEVKIWRSRQEMSQIS